MHEVENKRVRGLRKWSNGMGFRLADLLVVCGGFWLGFLGRCEACRRSENRVEFGLLESGCCLLDLVVWGVC